MSTWRFDRPRPPGPLALRLRAPNRGHPAGQRRPGLPTAPWGPGPGGGSVYVIAVGRLVRRKNLGVLVEAVAALGRLDVRLIVVGDGPEQALSGARGQRGLGGRVQFRGFVPQEVKYQLLAAADISPCPRCTRRSASSTSRPCMRPAGAGRRSRAARRTISTRASPAFCSPRTRTARRSSTRALGRLAADPELRARMGRHNRERRARLHGRARGRPVRRPVRPDRRGPRLH